MTTAGTVVFEVKLAADIVLAENGKYYVDIHDVGRRGRAREWTEGPFDTEAKARESLQWQFAVPVLESL